jgi:hypothetical protein
MKKMIGVESEPYTFEVEPGALRRFLEAVEDDDPRWEEEAPPNLLCTVIAGAGQRVRFETPFKRGVAGGDELELYQPVRPGDVITSTAKVVDIREREGRAGRMLFTITETTFRNQRGEVVAVNRSTNIQY